MLGSRCVVPESNPMQIARLRRSSLVPLERRPEPFELQGDSGVLLGDCAGDGGRSELRGIGSMCR
jgi:hypothetical protein